jgi:hypothetical protein
LKLVRGCQAPTAISAQRLQGGRGQPLYQEFHFMCLVLWIQIRMLLGLLDLDQLVRGLGPDLSIIEQK